MNITMKLFYAAALILVTTISLSGCKHQQNKPDTKTIKIGAILSLSGNLSFFGTQAKNGIDLALKKINKNNNLKIELISEDDVGDTKQAIAAYNKISLEKPMGLITAFTHISSALAPLAQQNQIPLIYNSIVNNLAIDNSYVFKDHNDSEQDAGIMAAYLIQKEIKKIYLIGLNTEALLIFAGAFEKEFNIKGGLIVGRDSFSQQNVDFKTQLSKVMNTEAQAILFASGFPQHTIPFAQQIKELKLDNQFNLAIPSGAFPEVIESVGDILNKTQTVCTWYSFDAENESNLEFVNDFRQTYGGEPNYVSAYTYDQTMILAKAIQECNSQSNLNNSCVKNQLLKIKNYQGVAGPLSFDENGVSVRETYLIQFGENGMQIIK